MKGEMLQVMYCNALIVRVTATPKTLNIYPVCLIIISAKHYSSSRKPSPFRYQYALGELTIYYVKTVSLMISQSISSTCLIKKAQPILVLKPSIVVIH